MNQLIIQSSSLLLHFHPILANCTLFISHLFLSLSQFHSHYLLVNFESFIYLWHFLHSSSKVTSIKGNQLILTVYQSHRVEGTLS